MVIFEAIQALFALNIQFFIDIFMGNLLWVLPLYMLVFILFNGKRTLYFFVLISVYIWVFLAFLSLTHFAVWTTDPFLFYLLEFVLTMVVFQKVKSGYHQGLITIFTVYTLFLYFTFFVVGGG